MRQTGIALEVPALLQQITDSQRIVEVHGRTVRECVSDLIKRYPETGGWFSEENPIVWITLNQNMVTLPEMDKPVQDGDTLGLILLIGGG